MYDFHSISTLTCVQIIFLPPYSPDLNLIEEAISKTKAWIHWNYDLFPAGEGFLYDVKLAMDIIMPEDAEGYFFHAGYFWNNIYVVARARARL